MVSDPCHLSEERDKNIISEHSRVIIVMAMTLKLEHYIGHGLKRGSKNKLNAINNKRVEKTNFNLCRGDQRNSYLMFV